MLVEITQNFDLWKLDIEHLMTIGIHNSARELQRIARQNAPYDTWKLKQGIATEEKKNEARIWPRKINYAVKREYENKKNPDRKFYMRKTAATAWPVVEKAFETAYNIVIKNIQWRS
jgi:hypothetical protein